MEVPEDEYSLRCSFQAHESDVRALSPVLFPCGGIVSGSRDLTIRLWKPNEDAIGFVETACLLGPTHFISSLCTLPSSTEHPHGLVLAGSNDCAIYGFSLDTYQAIFKLLGHSGTVSSLVAGNYGTILSGSWDKSARVWVGQKSVLVLCGHQEAIWAVALFSDQGLMITGSADKTIRLWRSGKTEKIFYGHKDCVRDLAIKSHSEFLSCSNDCTIRLWQTSGNCLEIFSGHTNYIYSIAILNEKGDFVSCSEDRTARVWKSGICSTLKEIPSSCVWSVACLSNGDFAVGGSNGNIYVFTKDHHFKASQDAIDAYEAEIIRLKEASKLPKAEMGMPEDLPGVEVLVAPGIFDGQKKICKEGDNFVSFEWDDIEKAWRNDSNLNDLRYPDSNFKPDGEKCQVFNIDVDGVLFKLPYLNCEDPYDAAEKFVNKHHITPAYIDQIAQHIIENTNLPIKNEGGGGDVLPFADPFTGADRYIPNSNPHLINAALPCNVEDSNEPAEPSQAFPLFEYVGFHTYNRDGLQKKLIEFSQHADKEYMATPDEIQSLLLLIDFPETVTMQQMESLQKILYWPDQFLFPALDLFRLAVRSIPVIESVSKGGPTLIRYLLKQLNPKNPYANIMFTLRIFCNFFGNKFGENLLFSNMEAICSEAASCVPTDYKQVEVALSTLYLNFAVSINKSSGQKCVIIAEKALGVFPDLRDLEATYRILVCIGTLLYDSEAANTIRSSALKEVLEIAIVGGDFSRKSEICAKQLLMHMQ